MPIAEINAVTGRSPEQKALLLETVRDVILDTLQVEEEAVSVWLREFPYDCVLGAGSAAGKRTVIRITCFSGRTPDIKRRLYSSLAERLASIGEDPAMSVMTMSESPLVDWGIHGGKCAADVLAHRQ